MSPWIRRNGKLVEVPEEDKPLDLGVMDVVHDQVMADVEAMLGEPAYEYALANDKLPIDLSDSERKELIAHLAAPNKPTPKRMKHKPTKKTVKPEPKKIATKTTKKGKK